MRNCLTGQSNAIVFAVEDRIGKYRYRTLSGLTPGTHLSQRRKCRGRRNGDDLVFVYEN
jgi:hypothetical protein